MTKDFSMDESAIRLIKPGSTIPYDQIDSVEIFEGIKVSKMKFMIVFWTLWLGVIVALLKIQGGKVFGGFGVSEITSWALLAGLGFLAANPIYNMFPHGTFLRIWYNARFIDLDITALTADD